MASWLKAAEDLFEVVDRRAKLVVGELAEEQSGTKLPASVGEQVKRAKSKAKAKKRPPADKRSKSTEPVTDQTLSEVSLSDATPGRISISSEGPPTLGPVSETSHEFRYKEEELHSVPSVHLPVEPPRDSIEKKDAAIAEVSTTVADVEVAVSTSDGRLDENEPKIPLEHPSSSLSEKEIEVGGVEHPTDVVQSSKSREADAVANSDQEKTKAAMNESPLTGEIETHAETKTGVSIKETKEHEQTADTAPTKVQDQLDEAQGLLKTTVSTGQSKEARLARVCAGLSSRLQEYKAENAQLEELLVAERELSKSYEAHIKQLQNDLSASKSEITKVESSMGEALAAKNKEIETLVNTMDALKKQAALNEGNLASLQANMESIMRNRELTETRMMQALREELASTERKAEEERAAHSASKMAAMERQVELEQRAVEASTALVRIQRIADERTTKVAELEQKVALLEVECSSLNQELQDMEARARRVQKKSPEDANQTIQIQAWQEEVERARQGQRESENKLSILEAEMQKMRVEMAAMNRDAEHYSRQEHMELEKRYRELTDLLYYKQTQLETMSSEKAAAEFQLEKELKRLQETRVEVERSRVSRRASTSWEEETEIKALEPLPLHHRHMAAASMQLQKAAKLLDTGAVRATRFLWRYPTARLILLFYLVFVHLFLMYLLHRLQEQADSFAAKELAESMGLSNPNLP